MAIFQQYILTIMGKHNNIIIKGAHDMKELFWNIFINSGNIDAFLAYKEYEKHEKYHVKRKTNEKENNIQAII